MAAGSYVVKECFTTLQGEGARTGMAAVFCRFTGCNLWSGLEKDRATAACRFCDTDFRGTDGPGGGRFGSAEDLALHIDAVWRAGTGGETPASVVFTGGEPLLQVDEALVAACKARRMFLAVETNGTRPAPAGLDWICVSPKPRSELVLRSGQELKLVFPQVELEPDPFIDLDFAHHFLQPMDGPEREANTRAAIEWCLRDPRWRLSLQTHKILGIA
jgi:7-carboxy-7-deazaguanine synthase (Cx14CxxC type)